MTQYYRDLKAKAERAMAVIVVGLTDAGYDVRVAKVEKHPYKKDSVVMNVEGYSAEQEEVQHIKITYQGNVIMEKPKIDHVIKETM